MADFMCWTTFHVCQWLKDIELGQFCETFVEHEIDGATLAVISERMSERLIPVIRKQSLFLVQLEILKSTPTSREHPPKRSDHSSQVQSDPDTSLVIPVLLRMAINRRDSDLKSASKTKLRTLLIQTLFDHLSMKTMYPTHLQYIGLLSTLITDYPFLRESIGSGYDSLLESLKNKFKKERRPLVANAEIQRIKARWAGRKRPHETAETNPRTTVDAGEDDRSIKEHLRVIKEETEKLRPNLELIKEKMALVKCYQRNFVSNHSTEETLSEFPCFRLAKILLWIMRDHTTVDVDQQILTQLAVMAPQVLRVSRSPLKEKFRCKIEDCVDGRMKKGLQLEAAILLLPALFKEDPGLLFEVEGHAQTSPSDIQTPKMLLKGCREGHPMQYDHIVLMLDGQLITNESEDISMALGLLLCIYFAFGIEYPKGLKKTLTFLECVVLKLKDAARLPVTVKRVYNSVCE
ncbi:sterile alpha motif domain-containing protein 3-like isoform X1 [Clarias gariepinus]|nr:sterile alpha motif domain-containing protein 3-like isoform X1 [Clarias gariepinus]